MKSKGILSANSNGLIKAFLNATAISHCLSSALKKQTNLTVTYTILPHLYNLAGGK